MRAALLPERAVIRITGKDATHFLQGLVTSDVESLAAGDARFTALLTPQGKILFDFFVVAVPIDDAGGFVIEAPRALEPALAERLGFYKLRAKVEVARRSDLAVAVALDGTPSDELGLVYRDPRHAGLGMRIVLPAEDAEAALQQAGFARADAQEWQTRRIALGVPEGGQDFVYGDTFPHEADMDQLGGVDFDKGCFVGQEVVSRMEHRGTARARVVPVTYDGPAPEVGTPVTAGERPLGALGAAAQGRALALLRLDRAAEALAAGTPLIAGGIELHLKRPAWARFAFPGDPKAAAE
jgi:tRNA-modifying protein YgfZ